MIFDELSLICNDRIITDNSNDIRDVDPILRRIARLRVNMLKLMDYSILMQVDYHSTDIIGAANINQRLVTKRQQIQIQILEIFQAAKELIMETDVPYIVNRGRKGGSNIAAAICNAIIYELKRI